METMEPQPIEQEVEGKEEELKTTRPELSEFERELLRKSDSQFPSVDVGPFGQMFKMRAGVNEALLKRAANSGELSEEESALVKHELLRRQVSELGAGFTDFVSRARESNPLYNQAIDKAVKDNNPAVVALLLVEYGMQGDEEVKEGEQMQMMTGHQIHKFEEHQSGRVVEDTSPAREKAAVMGIHLLKELGFNMGGLEHLSHEKLLERTEAAKGF